MFNPSDTNPATTPPASEWETLSALRTQLEAELFNLNKAALFDALESTGVTGITVSFDGYGDSGQIEDVQVRAGEADIAMPCAAIELATAVWGQPDPEISSISIATAVESLAYDVLERTHGGWENNDGAYGDIIFDVAKRTITLDYNDRYTATENYMHSF